MLDQVRPVYDSEGPFTTVSCDVSRTTEHGAHEVEVRWHDIVGELESEGAPAEDVEAAARRVLDAHGEPGTWERTVVVAQGEVLLDDLRPTDRRGLSSASHGPLPDLATWATGASGGVPFVLAVVDREGADLAAWTAWHRDPTVREVEGETFHLHKIPGGGWSHRRYQQTTEDTWHENAREVADEVRSLVRSHRPWAVLVAGEVGMRADVASMVRDGLAVDSPTSVHELSSGGRAPGASTESMWTEAHGVLDAERVRHEQELVERLEQARAHGAAAIGLDETLAALAEARVGTLLLGSDRLPAGEVVPDEHPGLPFPDHPDAHDVLPADLAVVAAACLTSAEVESLAPELLADLPGFDGCAALLRWEEPA